MSKYVSFLLFLAAIFPGAVNGKEDLTTPRTTTTHGAQSSDNTIINIMGALFLLPWVCLSLYCSCHPNSCYNRHCKTRGRVVHTTETRFGNIEIRQHGTFPFQDNTRRNMSNDTPPNPQPMISPNPPCQQVLVYSMMSAGGPLEPSGLDMPPAYNVAAQLPAIS